MTYDDMHQQIRSAISGFYKQTGKRVIGIDLQWSIHQFHSMGVGDCEVASLEQVEITVTDTKRKTPSQEDQESVGK